MLLKLLRRRPSGGPARSRGQSLAEFAIVFPVFMLIVGGMIQFGIILWGQNTLTQIARDTGRWAATQVFNPCDSSGARSALTNQANAIALQSSLIGYSNNLWNGAASTIAATSSPEGVGADWTLSSGTGACPPPDNQTVWYVSVRLNHKVPVFFPWIPGNGQLSTGAEFRMEPMP